MLDNLFTPTHLLFVLAIALLVFGPRKLPELGKGLGEGLRGFKQAIKGESTEDTVIKSEAKPSEKAPEVKTAPEIK
jgi:sec-independent protein translocase protein TatA